MTELKELSPTRAKKESPITTSKPIERRHRRHSLSDLLHLNRKLHLSAFKQDKISSIEEEPENDEDEEESPVWEKLNEKLYVTFADRSDSAKSAGHVNTIFQTDESRKHRYFASAFGKKGRLKEEYDDVKGLSLLKDGRLLTSDLTNGRLHLCDKKGRLLMIYGGLDLYEPWGIATLNNNNIAVTSGKNKCVNIITLNGETVSSFGGDLFKGPAGLAVDADGQFIVCDSVNSTVSIHGPDGVFKRFLGESGNRKHQFLQPRYVCVSSTGDIIVSDSGNHCIKIFDNRGDFVRSFGSYGTSRSQMKYPYGVCTSKYGEIYVADHYNNRITTFTRDGVFIHHLVTSAHGLHRPQGLAMNGDMKLYVSHGKLKASEILIFHLNSSTVHRSSEYTSHM